MFCGNFWLRCSNTRVSLPKYLQSNLGLIVLIIFFVIIKNNFSLSLSKYDSSTNKGTCIYSLSCVTTATVTCFKTDLGNKQGPLCYVGQFNGAKVVNCALGQFCAV